jgi:hypothetical protein
MDANTSSPGSSRCAYCCPELSETQEFSSLICVWKQEILISDEYLSFDSLDININTCGTSDSKRYTDPSLIWRKLRDAFMLQVVALIFSLY